MSLLRTNDSPFPSSIKEMRKLGWEQPDIILISGDAFVDHPAFGAAVIARVLHSSGFKVAIVPQPNWKDDLRDFKKFGEPSLFFAVSAGNMDSMVNHYTANKRQRSDDAYTPGGKAGFRPNYAVNVYSNILKNLYPEVPVIIGGIEASMRRFTHYDYWQDKLLPSVLVDSNADLLCYGMSEKSILEIALRIKQDGHIYNTYNVNQIVYLSDLNDKKKNDIDINSHELCLADKSKYAENFVIIEKESVKYNSRQRITQIIGSQKIIVNSPFPTLTQNELDEIYNLPFSRKPHPRYEKKEPIPAYEMIKNSVTIHRGCFGACSFCTISAHQGRFISSRSEKSIIGEVKLVAETEGFKGHITDLGGPSANMYRMGGKDMDLCENCKRPSCIYPAICKNLNYSHKHLSQLYNEVSELSGIKKISIGSGIRHDLIFGEKTGNYQAENLKYFELLVKKHVSGRLKVAPEHTRDNVLQVMRKPSFNSFRQMKKNFDKINEKYQLKQQLIPYFISAHPGCSDIDMAELAVLTNEMGFRLEQVQAFTPTPMTLSAVMYYTGTDPYTGKYLYSAKTNSEKEEQLMYFFWYKHEIKKRIVKKLKDMKRDDLLGKLRNIAKSKI